MEARKMNWREHLEEAYGIMLIQTIYRFQGKFGGVEPRGTEGTRYVLTQQFRQELKLMFGC